jgi:hypothetical protein
MDTAITSLTRIESLVLRRKPPPSSSKRVEYTKTLQGIILSFQSRIAKHQPKERGKNEEDKKEAKKW